MVNKDHALIVGFRASFAKLRDWIGDNPAGLWQLADTDGPLKDLCLSVDRYALEITSAERSSPELYSERTDPAFIGEWRDYHARYADQLSRMSLADVFDFNLAEVMKWPERSAKDDWSYLNDRAKEKAAALGQAVENFALYAECCEDEDMIEQAELAREGWNQLVKEAGFDVAAVLRRRSLVPFTLIPRPIADKYGASDVLSLMKMLQQAQEAFVFGIPFACRALMRSILEGLLKKHYGDHQGQLSALLDQVKLPREVNERELRRLKKRADSVLHFDSSSLKQDDFAEEALIGDLSLLQMLIESVPDRNK